MGPGDPGPRGSRIRRLGAKLGSLPGRMGAGSDAVRCRCEQRGREQAKSANSYPVPPDQELNRAGIWDPISVTPRIVDGANVSRFF